MAKRKQQTKVNKIKDAIHVVNLSSYSAPNVVENPRRDWIAYGDDNEYFQ